MKRPCLMPVMPVMLVVLILAACASEANYREKVDAWVGKTESELVASEWGEPQRTYDLEGGTRILSYTKSQAGGGALFPMMGIGIGSGGGGGGIGIGASTTTGAGGGGRFCETNFTVDDGIITDVSFQGDGCTS
jgi:hypothetical protein